MWTKRYFRVGFIGVIIITFSLSAAWPGQAAAQAGAPTPSPAPTLDARAPIFSTTGPLDPVLPVVSDRARQIYQAGLKEGADPRAFAKVGDCNSRSPLFLALFDSPKQYRLGPRYAHLQSAIDNFTGAFQRDSVSARDGFSTSSVFAAIQADRSQCLASESPIACEFRITRPSIVFVSLGTNGADWQTAESYERGLRRIIDYAIEHGALPILSTKADALEGSDARFNFIVQKLAQEYQLPLWNFWRAARDLPNFGLQRSYHLEWEKPIYDDPNAALTGWQVRNLTALQALDVVWRSVSQQPLVTPASWPTATPTPTIKSPTPRPTDWPPSRRHRWLEE